LISDGGIAQLVRASDS